MRKEETVVLILKENVLTLIMQTESIQEEALSNLNSDHEELIPYAEKLTYKANGRMNILQDLELLTNDEIVRIFTRQGNLEERLRIKKAEQVGKQVQQIEK